MGLASSVASFALGLVLVSPAARAEEGSTTKTTHSAESTYFISAGMSYWQEKFQLSSPTGQQSNITAVNWAAAIGVERQIQREAWGWLFDLQALIGQNEDQSTDPYLEFFNNRQSLYGALGGFGVYHAFEPGVALGAEISVLYRHISMSAPDGYTLNRFADTFDTLLKLEMTFPITSGLLAVQQFGYSFVSQNTLWIIGLRI